MDEEQRVARALIKNLVPSKLEETDKAMLDCPISKEEIERAILSMGNDRSPRPNGFLVEFYKKNIKWIVGDLYDLYLEAIRGGSLGKEINQGVIKLIPKEGDKDLLKKWRAITLPNVSYKILPKIISPTQTGFIKGRYILENLITCR